MAFQVGGGIAYAGALCPLLVTLAAGQGACPGGAARTAVLGRGVTGDVSGVEWWGVEIMCYQIVHRSLRRVTSAIEVTGL